MTSRAKRKKPYKPESQPTQWDMGATGPANRHGLRLEPATDFDPNTGRETQNPNGVKRQRRSLPIDELLSDFLITKEHHNAAVTLMNLSDSWSEKDTLSAIVVDKSAAYSKIDAMIDSSRQARRLWEMIPQPSAAIVSAVVIDRKHPREIGKRNLASELDRIAWLRVGLGAIFEGMQG